MLDVWDMARHLNQYVAIVAAVTVSYRLTGMLLDRPRWRDGRALHLMAWFTYVVAALFISAAAASYYSGGATPATWTSGARFLLHLSVIGLSLWWPHPRRFTRIEDPIQ